MLEFVESFGFTTREDPGDTEQTLTVLDLEQPVPVPLLTLTPALHFESRQLSR